MEPRKKAGSRVPRCRGPLRDMQSGVVYIPPMASTGVPFKNSLTRQPSGGDRFIPDRSAMDLDVAHYLLTESRKENTAKLSPRKEARRRMLDSTLMPNRNRILLTESRKENTAELSPRKEAYRRMLDSTLMPNRNRILAFRGKTDSSTTGAALRDIFSENLSNQVPKIVSKRRYIPQSADRTLDAPDIVDDFYLNLLDWGSKNVLSVALGQIIYLWDASAGSVSELMTVDHEDGPITSVSWAPDGRHLAVGLHSSDVQLWDSSSNKLVRTLTGIHQSRVGSLTWNKNILTTGGLDGLIANTDVRMRSPTVSTYQGHNHEICGLKWSDSGKQLASGGNDNLVHIWDVAMASSSTNSIQNRQNQWLHRFRDHTAAVKALAWCPFQSNLLATGGGTNDRCIKFWNVNTGARVSTIDTGSQVSGLLWSKDERELLSTHGQTQNQLTLWKYPSMTKVAELMGHNSRILYLAQSPNGCTVATASADETLRFWNVFGTPEVKKAAPRAPSSLPFSNNSHVHIR